MLRWHDIHRAVRTRDERQNSRGNIRHLGQEERQKERRRGGKGFRDE